LINVSDLLVKKSLISLFLSLLQRSFRGTLDVARILLIEFQHLQLLQLEESFLQLPALFHQTTASINRALLLQKAHLLVGFIRLEGCFCC